MKTMANLQLTLAIIKPHVVVRSKTKHISLAEAERFYEEHRHKFFYNRLVTFMTSGHSDLYILAKENAIKDWRILMGPTKVYKAQFESPCSIRGQFGLSDTRNATHGSDSPESAKREIEIFFPEFDYEKWFQSEGPKFQSNQIIYVENKFLHVIEPT